MTRKIIVDASQVTCDGVPYRVDVFEYLFDTAIEQLERIRIEESAYFGIAHFGRARFGEKDSSVFKAAVKAVEKL